MDLGSLQHAKGATKKRKRIGRGPGSGHGKTSTKGHKGQKARSGGHTRAWFEGGQMPLQRRIPKRGFTPIDHVGYQVVNIDDLARIEEPVMDPETFYAARLVNKRTGLIKVLGRGDITKAVEVHAHAFSESAVKKLEAAGGKAITL
jgi:large subunit ribosomal protein L15